MFQTFRLRAVSWPDYKPLLVLRLPDGAPPPSTSPASVPIWRGGGGGGGTVFSHPVDRLYSTQQFPQLHCCSAQMPREAAYSNPDTQTPTPHQTPQRSRNLEPGFLQFEISGTTAGAESGRKNFWPPEGKKNYDPMCLYLKYSEFCGEFKSGGKAQKIDPRPDLRVRPWLMEA